MPHSLSAKKSLRQNERRRRRNRSNRSALRSTIKKCTVAIESSQTETGPELLKQAVRKIDQAVAKHLLHKNTAARRKSLLTRRMNAVLAAQKTE